MYIDWSKYGISSVPVPTPEEIEQANRRAARMRAQAFRDTSWALAGWMHRAAAWIDARPAPVERAAAPSAGKGGAAVVA
jgi:hypothetical protein